MKKIICLFGILFFSVSSLVAEEIDFSELQGGKRNNLSSGYWEVAWGGKESSVGKSAEEILTISPLNYSQVNNWQKIGEFYLTFPEKEDYTLAVDVTSDTKGLFQIRLADSKKTVAETMLLVKGPAAYQTPFSIENPSDEIKIIISLSGETILKGSSLTIYKNLLQNYPIEDKNPLLGLYFRKFGSRGSCSEIFETDAKILNASAANLTNVYKDNVPVAFLDNHYRFLCYTKVGKESGITAPLLGKPDIIMTQRFFGHYGRLIFPDKGKYNQRWMGKKDKWNAISELLDSSLLDTDKDGIWNGQRPYPYVRGERLFDNYGTGVFIDYVLFIPATFFDVSLTQNSGQLSFTYINKEKKEKNISLSLVPELIAEGKTRIGFVNIGKGIEVVQKGETEGRVLTTVTDSFHNHCLPIKAQTLRTE